MGSGVNDVGRVDQADEVEIPAGVQDEADLYIGC